MSFGCKLSFSKLNDQLSNKKEYSEGRSELIKTPITTSFCLIKSACDRSKAQSIKREANESQIPTDQQIIESDVVLKGVSIKPSIGTTTT